jgi:hypothetical protein
MRYWVTPHLTLIRHDGRGRFEFVGRATGGAWVERPALIATVREPMVDEVDAGFAALVASYWGGAI